MFAFRNYDAGAARRAGEVETSVQGGAESRTARELLLSLFWGRLREDPCPVVLTKAILLFRPVRC